ncbi:uncharacterized protein BDR25DRAFT_241786 [Lindgomyces ingoldianus]|uniref:Uncharacterized protein n=1 Tax=Lindgomyces ingoldianus TaxID=673940 RepID=A0ACB6QF44_9PLEO|nr:uncharacterized protein BDR25DRAFT_241786 [Lindgomyces ingoldianus]KAF2464751.1 hypothetical protein BDR25DRAFT_241786 [Lindgomyces ingoldianus]
MPYNTRRKSLSLPSLGIAVPGGPRSARSPPSTATDPHHQPPAKKAKRTHSITSTPTSPPRTSTLRFDDPPRSAGRVADTPPPSPGGASGQTKVDTEGIDDTIVVGVIEQLEKTGNRPHLLKELAAVLSATIPIVESSANPAAIISSRLATYLKRPWTALSKCPLDKTLVGTHPKRVYYFLTTCAPQPIPADAGSGPATARIISPSLSSAASEEEDLEARSRDRMSPSPELDLSSPDFDDGTDPFSNQTHPPTTINIAHNRRAQSPPLERDEKEFTQTASFLQRRRSEERERKTSSSSEETQSTDVTMYEIPEVEETEESAARKNSETAAALFGAMDHVSTFQSDFASSSPMLKPALEIQMPPPMFKPVDAKMTNDEFEWGWSEMKSPEHVELEELDDLFGGY